MTKSDEIRALAHQGLTIAQIAQRLGIRYQHAYNVLKRSSASTQRQPSNSDATKQGPTVLEKPVLTLRELVDRGFALSSRWTLSTADDLILETPLPKVVGVYAFVKDARAMYVGLATIGLAKRIYFYGKPGATQRTSKRLNATIKSELKAGSAIDIYTATPDDLDWNGLPIHGSAGLEMGLIKKFHLPWNKRGASDA
ncbi:MAG TPA: GIY-YIG nuclease family protein [Alphaproteobacteria bacterium]|nr:GIY-YIG nuclease family protein [Alphaproteobacteria bacterium]